jgi:hypothetical protein
MPELPRLPQAVFVYIGYVNQFTICHARRDPSVPRPVPYLLAGQRPLLGHP